MFSSNSLSLIRCRVDLLSSSNVIKRCMPDVVVVRFEFDVGFGGLFFALSTLLVVALLLLIFFLFFPSVVFALLNLLGLSLVAHLFVVSLAVLSLALLFALSLAVLALLNLYVLV